MIFDLKRIDDRRIKGNGKSDGVQSIIQDLEEKNILMERILKGCLPKLAFSDKKKSERAVDALAVKKSLTHPLITSNQEMLAHLKRRPHSHTSNSTLAQKCQ